MDYLIKCRGLPLGRYYRNAACGSRKVRSSIMGTVKRALFLVAFALPLMADQTPVLFNNAWITPDDEYSYHNFHNTDLSNRSDMNDRIIYNADFSQDNAAAPFPADMHGVTFYNCNLCNAEIPDGNTVSDFYHNSGCSQ